MYSVRFKGIAKHGYDIPGKEAQVDMIAKTIFLTNNTFKVPSLTSDNFYIVDMNLGICECKVGQDGNVCKHQYVLWANGKCDSINFIPYLSATERKRYSIIASGEALPDKYYEGIHDHIRDENQTPAPLLDGNFRNTPNEYNCSSTNEMSSLRRIYIFS